MSDLIHKMNKLFSSIHEEASTKRDISSISTLFRDDQKISNISNVVNHLINVVQLLVDEMNVMKRTCSSYSKYGPKMALPAPTKIESSSSFIDMNLSKSRHVNVDTKDVQRRLQEAQRTSEESQQQRPLFQCRKCPMSFHKQEGLVKHMGMTHNGRHRSQQRSQQPHLSNNNAPQRNSPPVQNHVSPAAASVDSKSALKINRNVVPMSKGPMPARNVQPQPAARSPFAATNQRSGNNNQRANQNAGSQNRYQANRNQQSSATVPCTINGCRRKFTSSNSDEYLKHLQKDHQSQQQKVNNIASTTEEKKTPSSLNVVDDGMEETFPCTSDGCIKSFNDVGNLEFHKLLVHNKNSPSTQSKVDLMVEAKSKLLDKNGEYVSEDAPTKTLPPDDNDMDTKEPEAKKEEVKVPIENVKEPEENSKNQKKIQNFRRQRSFNCPQCSTKYLSKSALSKHVDQAHKNDHVDEDKSGDWKPSPSKRCPPTTAKKSRSKAKPTNVVSAPLPTAAKVNTPTKDASPLKEEKMDSFTVNEDDDEEISKSLTDAVMTEEDHEMEIKREIRNADIPLDDDEYRDEEEY